MLTFTKETHQYLWDGKEVPSVSKLLKTSGLAPSGNFYTAGSAERGTEIHSHTEAFDHGFLTLEDMADHAYRGFIEAWVTFKLQTGFKPLAIEARIFSPSLWLAGTVDRLGMIGSEGVILDIKSGQPQAWHKYQLAAYNLIRSSRDKRICVYLRADGSFKILTFSDDEDYLVVLSALTAFNEGRSA